MKYIIDGSFLYGHIKGVQRYARQITKELDKYMADKPYEVEIAVPEIDSEGTSAEINSYRHTIITLRLLYWLENLEECGNSSRFRDMWTSRRLSLYIYVMKYHCL